MGISTPPAPPDRRFPEIAKDAVDDLTSLISAQGRLVRLEMLGALKQIARRAAGLVVFAPLLLIGWAFLMLALAFALRGALGLVGALLLVGAVQAIAGGLGASWVMKQLKDVQALERSRQEIKNTVKGVTNATTTTPAEEGSHA